MRNYQFDQIKALLIILVVFAHIPLVGGVITKGTDLCECNAFVNAIVHAIYAFHMPLFVFVSGYFSKKRSLRETIQKNLNILKVFAIFHAFNLLLKYITLSHIPSLSDIITPGFALWYLLAIFYWRVLLSLTKDTNREILYLISTVIISIVSGFIPFGGQLGFQRTMSFLPFFYLGALSGNGYLKFKLTPRFWMLLVAIVILVISSGLNSWLSGFTSSYHSFSGMINRFISLINAFLIIVGILPYLYRIPFNKYLSNIGSQTLFIYIYHPYVLYIVTKLMYSYSGTINIMSAIIITIISMAILIALYKIRLLRNLLS